MVAFRKGIDDTKGRMKKIATMFMTEGFSLTELVLDWWEVKHHEA
jgi:hypothetical protein